MNIEKTEFLGLYIINPRIFSDERGWFMESFSKIKLENEGIETNFVQDNHSYSKDKGIIRGLHCQINPMAQTKLIRCTKGAIRDYVVDVRKNSKTYGKFFSIELSEENKKQLYIPKGFLHGFETLTNDVMIEYKVDAYYSKEHDRSIRWNDPIFGIKWQTQDPILSEKDKNASLYKDSDVNF